MSLSFLLYADVLLIVRLFFYFHTRPKSLVLYAIKTLIEIGAFLLFFQTIWQMQVMCALLLVSLNLLLFVFESKLVRSLAEEESTQSLVSLAALIGLGLYTAAFLVVFNSGKSIEVAPFLPRWVAYVRAAGHHFDSRRVLVVLAGGLLAASELRHLVRYVMVRFRFSLARETISSVDVGDESRPVATGVDIFLRRFETVGFAERLVVYVLAFMSQYIGLGIIIAGKALLVIGNRRSIEYAEMSLLGTFLSLAMVLLLSLLFRYLAA